MTSTRAVGAPSRSSLRGLDGLTFFVANLQTGFGPFVSVYLTSERWTQTDIGLVLTLGGLVSLFGQIPAGSAVDAIASKRLVAAISIVAIGFSAVGLALGSLFPVILFAWLLHSAASCTLTPAVTAMSLGLVGHARIAARLGRNASFASVGSAVAAAGMGACGTYISNQAVFFVTAALMVPAIYALTLIRPAEIDPVLARGGSESEAGGETGGGGGGGTGGGAGGRTGWWRLLGERRLLVLALCVVLFHLANAAMLPLVGSLLTLRSSGSAALLIAACLIVPQVMVATLSPSVGQWAQSWGRRPLLLAGFAALPVRGLCFSLVHDPMLLVAAQVFDGISAAALGVVVPLAIADIARRSGRFALAQGIVGTGLGLGGAVSTTVGGYLADHFGSATAFMGLSILGFIAFVTVFALMPETRETHR